MAKYQVWVQSEGESGRVTLSETEHKGDVTTLLDAILCNAGGAAFDAGITVAKGTDTPPPPEAGEAAGQQRAAAAPQTPSPAQKASGHAAGGSRPR